MPIIGQMRNPAYPPSHALNAILFVTQPVALRFRDTERGGTFLGQQVGEAVCPNVGDGE